MKYIEVLAYKFTCEIIMQTSSNYQEVYVSAELQSYSYRVTGLTDIVFTKNSVSIYVQQTLQNDN